MKRLNADFDDATYREFRHALLDDGLSAMEWIRRQVRAYLAGKKQRGRLRATKPPAHSRRKKEA